MATIFINIILLVSSYLLASFIIPIIREKAINIGLVDKPNKRKKHIGKIPLAGGISIALSTVIIYFSAYLTGLIMPNNTIAVTLGLSMLLLVVGAVDDKHDISARIKLLVQFILANVLFFNGLKIQSLYGFFGVFEMPFIAQYALTLIIIVGVINAYNLMDGIDGLLASIALNSFLILAAIAWWTTLYELMIYCLILAGSSLAFLKANFSKKQKIFLGDAGSLFIGFNIVSIALVLINSVAGSNKEVQITVWMIGLMSLPVIDSLRVYIYRMLRGKNPLKADRSHFHHIALQIGLSPKHIDILVSIVMLVIVIGLSISAISSSITLSVLLVLAFMYLGNKIIQFVLKMNHWKAFIKQNELS